MSAAERFEEYVHDLEHEELETLGLVLSSIARWPSGDERMLAYLETYLTDTRPTIIFIPYHYAEVRYAAGQALAAERAVQGIKEEVRVPASVIPLTREEMSNLAREAQLVFHPNPMKLLPLLLEKQLLPKRNHMFPARIPPGWKSEDS